MKTTIKHIALIALVTVLLTYCVYGVWFIPLTKAFISGLYLSLIPCYLHENL